MHGVMVSKAVKLVAALTNQIRLGLCNRHCTNAFASPPVSKALQVRYELLDCILRPKT